MKLDTFSILLALSILCTSLSVLFFVAWRMLRLPRMLLYWCGALGCYGLGTTLLLFRENLPIFSNILIVNLLLISCYALVWLGISIYRQTPPRLKTILSLMALLLLLIYYYAYQEPSLTIRIIVLRVFIIAFLAGILSTLLDLGRQKPSGIELIASSAFLLDALLRLIILVLQLLHLSDSSPLFNNSIVSLSALFSMIGISAWGISLALMTLASNSADLQKAIAQGHELTRLNAKNEERLQAMLEISQYQAQNIQDLLDFALQKVIDVTSSRIGYIYHYHEERQEFVLNSWSKDVMQACAISNPQSVYQLEKTGIWGEAVRQRQAIMVNDFDSPDPHKKGYPEGHVHLARFLTVPVFDTDRKIVAVVGVANKETHYTDQDTRQLELMMAEVWRIAKRLELDLKLSRALREWQTTFDAITDSVSLIDAEHKVVRCNLASKRLSSKSFSGIIGQSCCQFIHNNNPPSADCAMLRAKKSLKSEIEVFKHGDRWLEVRVEPLVNEHGVVTGAVHIVHDDTKRKQSENSLKELLSMLEAVHNELYVFDQHTFRFEYVNQSAQKNLGYTMEQLKSMTPLDVKPEFTAEEFKALVEPLRSGEKQIVRFETFHKRKDGSSYPVEVNLQLAETGAGKRFLAVIHDITERRSSDSALVEMQAQLLQNEKMAAIGQLSAGIAHEINNPMGFINSNFNTLEKYVEKFDRYIAMLEEIVQQTATGGQQQAAARLRKELKLDYVLRDIHQLITESSEGAERVLKIVQDLKTFSRSDTYTLGQADINRCLDSTINIVWNEIKYVAELKRDYGLLPKVHCNIQQINQVFMNLLVNAAHAVQSLETEEPGEISVKTWSDKDNVFIEISDTGCGISPELTGRIFDPFFTTKEVGKGTGLGLSISAGIIRRHGGEIHVQSEPGKGSCFKVTLPVNGIKPETL